MDIYVYHGIANVIMAQYDGEHESVTRASAIYH